jgi:hypothetical protein
MLVDAICWAVAIIFACTDTVAIADDFHKALLALGFIFVGTISRFVSVYREVHSKKPETPNNT